MIQLNAPWALLALASIPLILVLYSLRPTRRRQIVSTLVLWQEALRERQRGIGLQRLWRDLNLLLLLLLALILSIALADVRWVTRAARQGDVVLVLDVSASMKARTDGGTRFDAARREASKVIDDLAGGSRMLIMTSGRNAVLRSSFETDREALERVLDAIEPTDEAGRPRAALELARSLLRSRERARIVFVTDRAFTDGALREAAGVELIDVGAPARNVAITRFDFRREIGTAMRYQLLATLRNYTDEPVEAPLQVTLDSNPLVEQSVSIPARGSETVVLPLHGRLTGRARAYLDHDDDLDADNHAFAVLREESLRVLLFTPGNFYLESLFNALPNVRFTRMDEVWDDRFALQARRHDLVVFDRMPAPALPAGRFLLIDSVPPGLPVVDTGVVERPVIEGRSASPLVRDLDLNGVKIDAARRLSATSPSAGLQRLFWSEETALAYAHLEGERRVVLLGFDLSRSNFPLQAAFPLFFRQALDWLRPRDDDVTLTQTATGEPRLVRAPPGIEELVVRTPSGRRLRYPIAGGSLRFDETGEAGIYRYRPGEETYAFAVNLTDAAESDLTPRAPAVTGGTVATGSSGEAGLSARPLWPYLIAIAMVLLGLEWWVWCRRAGPA